ncbi:hypothetical protein [Metapseudomonas boanensis]|uniref:Uncharacterized protein n=1 Tax=Metapseudomonas boanensis TaxID=2822138 RepID=A0ABS5XP73_9GAMM|nr:hypothetical protein [Pseudomonas boanensis]MBT8768077.1 hypothetical protein [Pseudomonas boanensis]
MSGPTSPSKFARILAHLLTGASLNRFVAETLGDHCLNSTIATLANTHGLIISRQTEKVPNRWGKPCTVIRYSMPPTEMELASNVLARLEV